MPTSATGEPLDCCGPTASSGLHKDQAGFTLLELMVVVAIAGLASAAVALALRDSVQSQLDKDANALAAALEAGRAESRASGGVVTWRARAEGYEFTNGSTVRLQRWPSPDLAASGETTLLLGPEPVIGPQSVRVWSRGAPENSRWISTDGLRAFEVRNSPDTP